MGFDVTLHLVDERSIRRQLVPALLGSAKNLGPFGDLRRSAKLLDEARRSIREEEDPEIIARALTSLAIVFSSASLPHVETRGTALSLWDNAPKTARRSTPSGLGASPESLFQPIVAKRPDLRGRFPESFDENYTTGLFIPAARVKAARVWLAASLAMLTPGEREQLEPVERVMTAAAKHGLGYWEATDLDVVQAHEELIASPTPPDVEGSWRIPGMPTDIVARVGDLVFVRLANDALAEIDVSKLPPRVKRYPIDHASFVGRMRRGGAKRDEFVVVERPKQGRAPGGMARVRLTVRGASLSERGREAAPKWEGRAIGVVGIVDGMLYGRDLDAHPPRLLRWCGDTFVPVPRFPPAKGSKDRFSFGFARTGGGANVLVWDGNGYEIVRGRLTMTFKLGIEPSYGQLSAAPADQDAFYFLSKGKILRGERGRAPRRVATKLSNVMRLSPGPKGSLLVQLGDNRRAWSIAAVHADAKTVTGLHVHAVVARGDDDIGVEWSESAGALLVFTHKGVNAIPRSALGI